MLPNYAGRFNKESDYKKCFMEEVDRLLDMEMPVEQRIQAVQAITDAYFDQVREEPDSAQLSRLASFILRDDMRDSHPDKMTRQQYPVLTVRQSKRRQNRERSVGERTESLSREKGYNKRVAGF